MTQYCDEHSRVELMNGKCVACGEVKIKVKREDSINMQVAKVATFFIVILLGFIFISVVFGN